MPRKSTARPTVPPAPFRPTPAQIRAAAGRPLPDVLAPDLHAVLCGINPGLYTAAVGHHFARPGNRFWPALAAAGITERLLAPHEERELLARGYGLTNLVNRATAGAADLDREELRAGATLLRGKLRRYRPGLLAVLGVGAFRAAFAQPLAPLGPQEETIEGVEVWVLPSPSGLNAHYSLEDLAAWLRKLQRRAKRARD